MIDKIIQKKIQKLPLLLITLALVTPSGLQAKEIVTSILPLKLIAQDVISGDKNADYKLHNLIPADSDPHHFQLRPSDLKRLEQADIILWLGPEHEPFLKKVLWAKNYQKKLITIMELENVDLLSWRTESTHRSIESKDPHLWLNPENAKRIADALMEALGQTKTKGSFDELLGLKIKAQQDFTLMVYHDAYQYLEKRYGLKNDFIILPTHNEQIGLKRLNTLKQKIAEVKNNQGKLCLIAPSYFSRQKLSVLFEDLPNLSWAQIDPIGGEKTFTSYQDFIFDADNEIKKCFE